MADNPKEIPGGAPPETIKPKEPETNVLKFSFRELQFDTAFSIEDIKYLRFFVDKGKDSYFIEVFKEEYQLYFEIYTDLYEEAEGNESCTCDEVIVTDFEIIDELQVTINAIIAETNEEVQIEEKYKIYLIFNLVESFELGIHSTHEEEIKD